MLHINLLVLSVSRSTVTVLCVQSLPPGRLANIWAVVTPSNTSKSASTSHTVLLAGSCRHVVCQKTDSPKGRGGARVRTVPLTMYADIISSIHREGSASVVCFKCHAIIRKRRFQVSLSSTHPEAVHSNEHSVLSVQTSDHRFSPRQGRDRVVLSIVNQVSHFYPEE